MIKTLDKIQSTVHINCYWKMSQWLWQILVVSWQCENIASFHITEWSSPQNYILLIETMTTIIYDFQNILSYISML